MPRRGRAGHACDNHANAGGRAAGGGRSLGAGAALSVAGAGLAELNDTVGGLVAVVGGALVVIAATIGFPAGD